MRTSTLPILLALCCSTLACPRPATDTSAASAGAAKTEPAPAGTEGSAPESQPAPEPETAGAGSAEGAAAPADTRTLKVDASKSTVGFAVARATVGHIGKFEDFDASLELADGTPVGLEIRVKTGSVVADRPSLTSHLLSADFFHVDKFPTPTFTAKQFTPDLEAGPDVYEVSGTMHLHGVRRKLESRPRSRSGPSAWSVARPSTSAPKRLASTTKAWRPSWQRTPSNSRSSWCSPALQAPEVALDAN